MRRHSLFAVSLLALLLPGVAHADEVSSAITEAAGAYQSGNTAATRTLLEEALQFLAQRAAAKLGSALPAPLPGWQAFDRQPRGAGSASFGGGNQVIRRYKNAENQSVEIRITVDSPVLSQLTMVMSNTASPDALGKVVQIGNRQAIQTSNNEIQMLVADRILVTVTGTAAIESKLAYAGAMDLTQYAGWR